MGILDSYSFYSGDAMSHVDEAAIQEAMDELEEMDDVEVSDDLSEACIQAAIANEQNFNTILMSVAQEEMAYFVENGVEMVYEEGKVSAFFEKIKKMLKKAWEKIKSIFNKALDHIRSWISSDKRFVQKYGDEIKKHASSVKIDGYNVDGNKAATATPYSNVIGAATFYINRINKGFKEKENDIDDIAGRMRSKVAGGDYSAKKSSDELIEYLKKDFGMMNKSDSFTYDGTEVYNELAKGNTTSKVVKSGYSAAKSTIAKLEASTKQLRTIAENTKDKDMGKAHNLALSVCSSSISILNACQRVQLGAVSTYHTNCRKIAAKCVSASKKKSNESFEFDDFDLALV